MNNISFSIEELEQLDLTVSELTSLFSLICE
jgi:hypothetical protein